jgi:hypothetical protein
LVALQINQNLTKREVMKNKLAGLWIRSRGLEQVKHSREGTQRTRREKGIFAISALFCGQLNGDRLFHYPGDILGFTGSYYLSVAWVPCRVEPTESQMRPVVAAEPACGVFNYNS